MKVRKYTDIEERAVETEGAEGVGIRVLISEEDGAPNFVMRRFSIQPGGHTPYHTHSWEHVVFVLSGSGNVRYGDRTFDISSGSAVLVEPDEEHNFSNTGTEPLVFLCSIPIV
jgi:quercetin dioxygenase-like cupin family protein